MAKKKDTLKDLNDFMKNQNVPADEGGDFMNKKPTVLANIEKLRSDVETLAALPVGSLHEAEIVKLIQKISESAGLSSRQVLFNIAEKVLEETQEKDHIDILFENHISFLKYHQLVIDKLNS